MQQQPLATATDKIDLNHLPAACIAFLMRHQTGHHRARGAEATNWWTPLPAIQRRRRCEMPQDQYPEFVGEQEHHHQHRASTLMKAETQRSFGAGTGRCFCGADAFCVGCRQTKQR